MRGVRAVPAALPDLPGDGRGVGVAARADRGDACRPLRRSPARRRLHPLHGPVRAVPRLRGGLPVVGAVRPPDGRRARHPRQGDALPAVVAAGGLPPPRPPPPPPGGVDRARGRPARRSRAPPAGSAAPAAAAPPLHAHRHRRLAVHRLRDGRLDAARARVGDTGPHRGRRRGGAAGFGRGLLRRAACARRAARRRACAGPPRDGVDAGRRARARRLGRLRRGAQGLRAPARHARRRALRRPRAGRERVAGASRRRAAGRPWSAPDGGRAGPLSPGARAEGAPARANRAAALRRRGRARRRRPLLWRGWGLRGTAPRARRRDPRPQGRRPSAGAAPPWWPAPTRGA